MPDGRPRNVKVIAFWQWPDQPIQVPGLEVVGLGGELPQVADPVVGYRRREYAVPIRARTPVEAAEQSQAAGHRRERGPAAGRAAADAESLAVRLARFSDCEGSGSGVGDIDHAPLPAQPLSVGAAVPARAAVVDVDDPDAPAGEVRLLQVEQRVDL